MQDDGDDRRLQRRRALDGQVYGGRCFGFHPVAEAAKCAVSVQRRADAGDQAIEGAGPAGARLDDDFQLGLVLIVVTQRR